LYDRLLRGHLLANRTVVCQYLYFLAFNSEIDYIFQILVTHHVELVLPGAYYLVRMLDGRIDTQGTIKDLRTQGILDDIAQDATVEAHKEEQEAVVDTSDDAEEGQVTVDGTTELAKKPRKLIKDEHRETGGVKWTIYKSYLKASYVVELLYSARFGLISYLAHIGYGISLLP
jgi:hypothetical protein